MQTLSLHGAWDIHSTDGTFKLKGEAPTSFFYELEKSGYWGEHDVFYRENNRQCVELAKRDILFTKTLPLAADFLKSPHRRVFLEADGLDTLTDISINGK